MKEIIGVVILFASVFVPQGAAQQTMSSQGSAGGRLLAYAPSGALRPLLTQVRAVPAAEYRVGYTDEPGEFYRLSRRVLAAGAAEDFEAMLRDGDAKVRLMGAICLAQVLDQETYVAATTGVRQDEAVVVVTNGCVLEARRTVGGVVEEIISGRYYRHGEVGGALRGRREPPNYGLQRSARSESRCIIQRRCARPLNLAFGPYTGCLQGGSHVTNFEQIDRAIRDLEARGIKRSIVAPPLYRLAWRLGLPVRPPLFEDFATVAAVSGSGFGVLWGGLTSLGQYAFFEPPTLWSVVFYVCGGGALFGLGMAISYRVMAKRFGLPSWDDYAKAVGGDIESWSDIGS